MRQIKQLIHCTESYCVLLLELVECNLDDFLCVLLNFSFGPNFRAANKNRWKILHFLYATVRKCESMISHKITDAQSHEKV